MAKSWAFARLGKAVKASAGDARTGNPLTKSAFLAAANNRGWTASGFDGNLLAWLRQTIRVRLAEFAAKIEFRMSVGHCYCESSAS